jgi:acetyl-CoA carboxylase carboxyl transferase subunit beta
VDGHDIVIACMDFEFIGGSLGSVMGEKFSRAVDYCIEHRCRTWSSAKAAAPA